MFKQCIDNTAICMFTFSLNHTHKLCILNHTTFKRASVMFKTIQMLIVKSAYIMNKTRLVEFKFKKLQ